MRANIIINFSIDDSFGKQEFLSMMFYLGILTIKGDGGSYDVVLSTPNAVIRDVYYGYYSKCLEINDTKILDAIDSIAF